MHRTLSFFTLSAALLLALILPGCAPSGIRPATAFTDLPPAETDVSYDAKFLYELSEKRYCTVDDVYRGMLYFIDGTDTADNFEQRTARLVMHEVIDKRWTHSPNSPVTKGRIGYMLARAIGIRGGVMYNITGASERYALRELSYRGIVIGTSENAQITGSEYVGILGRADDYRQAQSQ